MNIGLQYWSEGGSAPGSFTTWDVVTCYARPSWEMHDQGRSDYSGANWGYDRKYIRVTIVFSPKTLSDATDRAALETLLDANYFRVSDTRHAALGGSNTIDFVKAGNTSPERARATMKSEFVKLELITEDPQ